MDKEKLLNEFTGTVRRAVDDYHMIEEGDKVAVGVSGGKDSLILLLALHHLQSFYPKPFHLEAITIELGFEGMDFTPVKELCAGLQIPYTCLKTDIKEVVFDVRKESNPCSLCAKMRRGALGKAITDAGIHKIALGHHRDDAAETFLMSLIYEGRLATFAPVTYLDRTGITVLRPLLYCREYETRSFAAEAALPVTKNPCPADGGTKRQRVKEIAAGLREERADIYEKIFGAIRRCPLKGWEEPLTKE
jgi:tRNA(Ile)-lysidine synthase TilS/MesJ